MHQRLAPIVAAIVLGACAHAFAADQPQSLPLWPDGAPGSAGNVGPESVRLTELGEYIISNVHTPSITPYLPAPEKRTGAAFVVVPGGGHASSGWITRATASRSSSRITASRLSSSST